MYNTKIDLRNKLIFCFFSHNLILPFFVKNFDIYQILNKSILIVLLSTRIKILARLDHTGKGLNIESNFFRQTRIYYYELKEKELKKILFVLIVISLPKTTAMRKQY